MAIAAPVKTMLGRSAAMLRSLIAPAHVVVHIGLLMMKRPQKEFQAYKNEDGERGDGRSA